MQNKRFCFVITKSEVGGAQKWVKEQIDILNKHGYQCFICTNQEGWLTKNSKTAANLIDKRIEQRVSFGFVRTLNRFIKKNNIDLVVGNSANGGIYSRLSGLLTSTACIYVSHGWSSVYNGGRLASVYNWVEKGLAGISSKVLCVSEDVYHIAHETIGISNDKLEVIVNKIYPIETASQRNLANGTDGEVTKLLFLGRLAAPKLPMLLVEAVANVPSLQLDIVGDGPDMDAIKERIEKDNVQNVNLRGEVENFQAFNNYDILCLVSESEALGLSAVEAMSCGLPVLASNVGGCIELIDENGYLTDNSPEDILNGIHVIQNNLERYAKNSKELFLKKFDLSTNYRAYLDLYEEVLA